MSNETKWTPGPWFLRLSDNATPHIMHEGGDDWTNVSDKSSLVCVMPAEITDSYNALNNARLISAAPDLYEALEMALSCHVGTDEVWIEEARAALKKARGES